MPERHHYCTLFDSRYLARAVVLHRSLVRSDPNFLLRAVCMDDASAQLLGRLSLPRVRVVPIKEIEDRDPELLAVRSSRTSWEYCWTATPAVCRHFLETEPELESLTYLDSDLYLWNSPAPLFDQLDHHSILLIPHRSETEETFGVYNVGWVTFRNDATGRSAVRWWRERCLEWCYDRVEPNRYGDQKYLDDWPERFDGVRVSRLAAAGLAPWNEDKFAVVASPDGGAPLVDGQPLIYFHHAGLRIERTTWISRLLARRMEWLEPIEGRGEVMGVFSCPRSSLAVGELIWRPYLESLMQVIHDLTGHAPVRSWVDAPRPGLLLWLFLRRELPGLAAPYRRLPRRLRHLIGRPLTSRERAP